MPSKEFSAAAEGLSVGPTKWARVGGGAAEKAPTVYQVRMRAETVSGSAVEGVRFRIRLIASEEQPITVWVKEGVQDLEVFAQSIAVDAQVVVAGDVYDITGAVTWSECENAPATPSNAPLVNLIDSIDSDSALQTTSSSDTAVVSVGSLQNRADALSVTADIRAGGGTQSSRVVSELVFLRRTFDASWVPAGELQTSNDTKTGADRLFVEFPPGQFDQVGYMTDNLIDSDDGQSTVNYFERVRR